MFGSGKPLRLATAPSQVCQYQVHSRLEKFWQDANTACKSSSNLASTAPEIGLGIPAEPLFRSGRQHRLQIFFKLGQHRTFVQMRLRIQQASGAQALTQRGVGGQYL